MNPIVPPEAPSKPWWQSRAMVASYAMIFVWLLTFFLSLFHEGTTVLEAAKQAATVCGVIAPVLGGLWAAGMRGAKSSVGLILLALFLQGCVSPPRTKDPALAASELAASASGPKSGQAEGKSATAHIPFGPATAWGASSATSSVTNAGYEPVHTNTASGSLVTGFVQGIAGRQAVEAVKNLVKEDPVLRSIADEMVALMETDPASRDETWAARIDALRERYTAARTAVLAQLTEFGATSKLSLQSLQTLVVVGFIGGSAGHEERPLTKAEAETLGMMVPNIVAFANGLEGLKKANETGSNEEVSMDNETPGE